MYKLKDFILDILLWSRTNFHMLRFLIIPASLNIFGDSRDKLWIDIRCDLPPKKPLVILTYYWFEQRARWKLKTVYVNYTRKHVNYI